MSAVELSIIIVSYNVSFDLRDCLNSIRANTQDVDYEIIVIDNNSHDESVDVVESSFPGVRLIKNPANLGFARASNQGVEIAMGSYILFLNPDTVLLNNACLLLLNELRSHEKVGIVGPKLFYSASREYYPSIRRFTKPRDIFIKHLPFYKKISSVWWGGCQESDAKQDVDWLVGAALLLPKILIDELGSFDEAYFLYSEDEDLCLRFHRNGYHIRYHPEAEIIHLGGKSSQQCKHESIRLFWKSQMLLFRRNYSKPEVDRWRQFFMILLWLKIPFVRGTSRDMHRTALKVHQDIKQSEKEK